MSEAWKELERQTARALGGRRHLRRHYGEAGGDIDLPENARIVVEVKYRGSGFPFPSAFLDGLNQAARAGPDKVPVLVLKAKRMRGALVCLHLEDFVKLLNGEEEDHAATDPSTPSA